MKKSESLNVMEMLSMSYSALRPIPVSAAGPSGPNAQHHVDPDLQ